MEVRGIFQGSFGGSLIKFKRKPEEESVKDIKDIAGTLISPRKKNGTSKHTHESESARERSLSIESPRRVLKNTKNWKSEETLWVQQLTPLKMAEKFYNSKKHGG